VIDNYAEGSRDTGISATGTVRGNVATNNSEGIYAGVGSTVIGNSATNNRTQGAVGILADCPSNLTDNTAVNNGRNLVLNGDGCHDEDNVAP
jgi:parallel beta-helix repeat protein